MFAGSQSRSLAYKYVSLAATVLASLVVGSSAAHAQADHRQFTFSWPFSEGDAMRPRGGTSRGAALELDTEPAAAWYALRAPGIDAFERDRRAILAMVGEYRTSFDFIETVGFTPGFTPSRPYQSWGTETIFVIEDAGTQISLQHVIVMFVAGPDGEVMGPFVQKHWRQEWRYEDTDLHEYAGRDRWQRRKLAARDARGTWSQAVFQVDDSPRYEAIGTWRHERNYSAWTSAETWRPLPRRESSVRDDYDVLIGQNRHTIVPTGWVQEEENLKVALGSDGKPQPGDAFLARELGVNRYERVRGFDFSEGEAYWRATSEFWSDVRAGWENVFAQNGEFVFREVVDGRALWQEMFEFAAQLEAGADYDEVESRRFVRETLAKYVN
jgi:hypothetical protein